MNVSSSRRDHETDITSTVQPASNVPYSWFELFAGFWPALTLLVAVLPSVSAARHMSFKSSSSWTPHARDAIDRAIAVLPTSWPGIIVVTMLLAAGLASLVVGVRHLVLRVKHLVD